MQLQALTAMSMFGVTKAQSAAVMRASQDDEDDMMTDDTTASNGRCQLCKLRDYAWKTKQVCSQCGLRICRGHVSRTVLTCTDCVSGPLPVHKEPSYLAKQRAERRGQVMNDWFDAVLLLL
jgi:hypothetical protein